MKYSGGDQGIKRQEMSLFGTVFVPAELVETRRFFVKISGSDKEYYASCAKWENDSDHMRYVWGDEVSQKKKNRDYRYCPILWRNVFFNN